MCEDQFVRDAWAQGFVGKLLPKDHVPWSARLVRQRDQLSRREPAVLHECLCDQITINGRDVVERHGHLLADRVVEKCRKLRDDAFAVLVELVIDWTNDWTELPCFKVIAHETVRSCLETFGVDEEQQLVDAEIGQVKSIRVVMREQKITDLSCFVHVSKVSES